MGTRFSYDKSDAKKIKDILGLYLTDKRTQLATDILIDMYKRYADRQQLTRQYMLVRNMKKVPKSNIQEALADLLKIRAIRNEGAMRTISQYKPSLNELGTALSAHSIILKGIHKRMIDDPKSHQNEAFYSKIFL